MASLSLNNLSGLGFADSSSPLATGQVSLGIAGSNAPMVQNPVTLTPANSSGQTLGAATSRPAPTAAPATVAQPSTQDIYNSVSGKINQSYDTLSQNFDQQSGMLPEQRSNLEQQVNNLFSGNQDTLNLAKQGALDQLTGSANQVQSRQQQSMQTLDQRMRDLLQASDKTLGNMGVNGSGQQEVQMAISKYLSQAGGQIQQQANDLYNQIELKKADVANTYMQEASKLKTWQSDNMLKIGQWFDSAMADIQNRKATANAQRYQDLANLEAQLKSQALSMANAVQSSAGQYQNALDQWAQQHADSLNGMQSQITSSLSIDPSQINGSFDTGSGTFSGTAINGGLGSSGVPVGDANSSWLLPSIRRDQVQ